MEILCLTQVQRRIQLIYRVKYPTYGELGETLARRTNETNGSFVVDEFKLEIHLGSSISGVHRITTSPTVVKADEENTALFIEQILNTSLY